MGYTENASSNDMGFNVGIDTQPADPNQEGRPTTTEGLNRLGGHLSQGLFRSSTDKHKAAEVQSISIAKSATWEPLLTRETLHSLIQSYPKGNVVCLIHSCRCSSLKTNDPTCSGISMRLDIFRL